MKKNIKNIIIINLVLLFNVIFIDNIFAQTYNNYSSATASCGNGMIKNIPTMIPRVISILYTIIQVGVPIVLVIFGMLDLFKGITAGKDDDIKKGQKLFVKRLISAALVFFVLVFVKIIISFSADNSNNIINCAECFIKNNCAS